jgi:3-hydroxyisobutyrate dehydrogenase
MKVAFVGLGVMGFPMAGHLKAKGGHDVAVFNRTGAKAAAWVQQHGGRAGATPREAAEGAEIVFLCVGNDEDVRSVVFGDAGVLAAMKPGSLLVDHTTTSAGLARELADACAKQGIQFLDAPVSGGQAGAVNGQLTVMVGGEQAVFDRAKPVIDSYAKACVLIGPVGDGQLAKMMNQICIAGLVQGLSEAINFGMKAGLDIEKVIAAISKGAAQSWQMENRWKTMVDDKFDFGFAIDWMRKDLGYCMAEAEKVGAKLPVTRIVDGFYAEVQKRGGGRFDTSSLMYLLRHG